MSAKKGILVFTQKVSSEDPVLGFFHGWLVEMAKHFDQVTVVCLEKGQSRLPKHVRVFSLGKEQGLGRFNFLKNFYRIIWNERGEYGSVFVHMNPEYVLLGGLFWRVRRIPVCLWYNHAQGGVRISLARFFARKVFYTSRFAFPSQFKNSMRMPAGIDVVLFKPTHAPRRTASILSLGRIAPIKRVDRIVDAATILDERKIDFLLSIYGDALPRDSSYEKSLKESATTLLKKKKIVFHAGIPNYKTPSVYSAHDVFVNMSPDGLYDKTILEACACETVPLVSSHAFADAFPAECFVDDASPEGLAAKMRNVFALSTGARLELGKRLRSYVILEHSLAVLMEKIARECQVV